MDGVEAHQTTLYLLLEEKKVNILQPTIQPSGNRAELKKLLKKESKDYVNSKTGDYGQTLLHVAAYEGQVEILELLIDKVCI